MPKQGPHTRDPDRHGTPHLSTDHPVIIMGFRWAQHFRQWETCVVLFLFCSTNQGLRDVPAAQAIPVETLIVFLDGNAITELRAGAFSSLPQLQTLSLHSNNISIINPGAFNGLQNLQVLSLSRNILTELHNSMFGGLWKLRLLDLGWNRIENIQGQTFRDLVSLEELRLHGNRLRTLDATVLPDHSGILTLQMTDPNVREHNPLLVSAQFLDFDFHGWPEVWQHQSVSFFGKICSADLRLM